LQRAGSIDDLRMHQGTVFRRMVTLPYCLHATKMLFVCMYKYLSRYISRRMHLLNVELFMYVCWVSP
jgi:hypothetical protein